MRGRMTKVANGDRWARFLRGRVGKVAERDRWARWLRGEERSHHSDLYNGTVREGGKGYH